MIKLIAIDLDGTMYTTQRSITANVRSAVAGCLDNGLQPAIVTGRGRRGVDMALESLGLDLPFICSAGALVSMGPGREPIHTWSFHVHQELLHVIQFARQHKTGVIAEPEIGNPYWFGPDAMNAVMDPLTIKDAHRSIRTFDPERDFDRPMLKVTLTAPREQLEEAKAFLHENCPSIHQVFSGAQYIDLTANGVNKGSALRALAEHLGLQPAEVAAIGDQDIDVQMLQYAGLPIAMANGASSVQQVAQWIAPSNDEDGVVWAIEKIQQQNIFSRGQHE